MPDRIWRDHDLERFTPVQLDRRLFCEIWDLIDRGTGVKVIADDHVLTSRSDLDDLPDGRIRNLQISSAEPWCVLGITEGKIELFGDAENGVAVNRLRSLSELLHSRRRPTVASFVLGNGRLWRLLNSLVGWIIFLYLTVPESERSDIGFQVAVVVLSTLSMLGVIGLCGEEWVDRRTMALVESEQSFVRKYRETIAVGTILSTIGAIIALAISALSG